MVDRKATGRGPQGRPTAPQRSAADRSESGAERGSRPAQPSARHAAGQRDPFDEEGPRAPRRSPGATVAPRRFEIREAFATCPPGLEDVLVGELEGLGLRDLRPVHGGVPFPADLALVARVNLWLRSAFRVLLPVAKGPAGDKDALYRLVRSVEWPRIIDPGMTLAVQATVRETPALTNSVFAAQVVKDAVVDRLRQQTTLRPNVDRKDPDLPIVLHLLNGRATLSLDSSGRSLHRRGYRPVEVKAPLNEALAAGIVLSTGYRGQGVFLDPMCGSGTLPIEAALIASNTAPGLLDPHFAFLRWPGADRSGFAALLDEARAAVVRHELPPIVGSEPYRSALRIARGAVEAAGQDERVRLLGEPLASHRPRSRPDFVVVNPPYGERLGEEDELQGLYYELGTFLREHCSGAQAFVLSGNPRLSRHLGLKASGRRTVFNGAIECRLLRYELRRRDEALAAGSEEGGGAGE